ncbi:MAG: BrnT family toxin [Desulfobaccales bacterium]
MLNFEWDDAKAAANFRKHGVTFEQAAYAFRDPFAVEWIDERSVYGEERVILLGMSGGQILSVVYTERGESIRMISARRATKHEKDNYYCKNAR